MESQDWKVNCRHSLAIFGRLGARHFPMVSPRSHFVSKKDSPQSYARHCYGNHIRFLVVLFVGCYDSPIIASIWKRWKCRFFFSGSVSPEWTEFNLESSRTQLDGTIYWDLSPQGVWQSGRSVPNHPERCQGRCICTGTILQSPIFMTVPKSQMSNRF